MAVGSNGKSKVKRGPYQHLLLPHLVMVTTVPSKKKLLPKSQLLWLVGLPLGFMPVTQASRITHWSGMVRKEGANGY